MTIENEPDNVTPASGLYRPALTRLCLSPDGDAGGQADDVAEDTDTGGDDDQSLNDLMDSDGLEKAVQAREKAGAGEGEDEGADQKQQQAEGDEGAEDLSWRNQPLHPAMAKKYGCKTQGEFADRYGASSTEAKRLAEESRAITAERDEYKQAVQEILRARAAEIQRGQQQQQAAAPAKTFYGFASEAELQAAMKADPETTKWRVFMHQMKERPEMKEMLREMVQPELKPVIEKHQKIEQNEQREIEEAFTVHVESQLRDVLKDERFAPGGPLNTALQKWYQENYKYEEQRARMDPKYNLWARAQREILAQLDGARATASEEKLKVLRGKAATAKPGTGGLTAPARGGTFKQGISRIAQEMRAAGEEIPDAVINDLQDQLTEKLPFLNR